MKDFLSFIRGRRDVMYLYISEINLSDVEDTPGLNDDIRFQLRIEYRSTKHTVNAQSTYRTDRSIKIVFRTQIKLLVSYDLSFDGLITWQLISGENKIYLSRLYRKSNEVLCNGYMPVKALTTSLDKEQFISFSNHKFASGIMSLIASQHEVPDIISTPTTTPRNRGGNILSIKSTMTYDTTPEITPRTPTSAYNILTAIKASNNQNPYRYSMYEDNTHNNNDSNEDDDNEDNDTMTNIQIENTILKNLNTDLIHQLKALENAMIVLSHHPRCIWELDDDHHICLICHKVFTICLRRHHCRLCGGIFCNQCTSYRLSKEAFKQLQNTIYSYTHPLTIPVRNQNNHDIVYRMNEGNSLIDHTNTPLEVHIGLESTLHMPLLQSSTSSPPSSSSSSSSSSLLCKAIRARDGVRVCNTCYHQYTYHTNTYMSRNKEAEYAYDEYEITL